MLTPHPMICLFLLFSSFISLTLLFHPPYLMCYEVVFISVRIFAAFMR